MTLATSTFRTSGDLIADRRYAYAEAALRDGDHAAAADLAVQVLERVPLFAPAHALLGRARAAGGEAQAAIAALSRALELEPQDELGARIDLARLGALPPEDAITPGYLRALFDDYAQAYERHLVESLHYRGPDLLHDAIRWARADQGRPFRFERVLDLGCGTGLMARALAGTAAAIDGIDLSPRMLAAARRTRLYRSLHEAEIGAFLKAEPRGAADLVTAADVLVYVAALDGILRQVRRVLRPGGLFAFTVQAHDGNGVVLGADARYAHGEAGLRRLAAEAELAIAVFERVSTRQDRGVDVPGFLLVLRS